MIIVKRMETAQELEGKARVHYTSWQETYQGLLSDDYLAGMSYERCLAGARRWQDNVLVAKDGDRVVGFVSYGVSRDKKMPDAGEILGIYLLEEYQGQGIGYRLMHAAMEQMTEYKTILLWVLMGNRKAIRFYERYGFRYEGEEREMLIGGVVIEQRMVYHRN